MALKAVAAPLGSPVGGSGTPDTIPRWATGTTLGNSIVTQTAQGVVVTGFTNGLLPISGSTPTNASFLVRGPLTNALFMGASNASPFGTWLQSTDTAVLGNWYPLLLNPNGGNVGIGTASPSANHRVDAFSTGNGTDGSGQYRAIYTGGRGTNFGGSIGFGGYFTGTTPTVFAFITGGKDNATDGDFGGHLDFYTRPNGGAYTRAVTIDSAFNLALNTANTGATIQAAGSQQGLKLPATPGNADANTLDAYRDGGAVSGGVAFTATLKGLVSDPTTPVTVTGQYVLVGKMLVMQIYFANVNTTGASGAIYVTTGLAAALRPAQNAIGSVSMESMGTITGTGVHAICNTAAELYIAQNNSNAASTFVTHNAGAARGMTITVSYIVP